MRANEWMYHSFRSNDVVLQLEDVLGVGEQIGVRVFGRLDRFRTEGIEHRANERLADVRWNRAEELRWLTLGELHAECFAFSYLENITKPTSNSALYLLINQKPFSFKKSAIHSSYSPSTRMCRLISSTWESTGSSLDLSSADCTRLVR